MKKTFLLLSLLFINTAFSTQEKQEEHQYAQKSQLSRMDKAKICGALAGSVFFLWVALTNYNLALKEPPQFNNHKTIRKTPPKLLWHHYAAGIPTAPVSFIAVIIEETFGTYINIEKICKGTAAYTSLLSLGLGYYAYKKIAQATKDKAYEAPKP